MNKTKNWITSHFIKYESLKNVNGDFDSKKTALTAHRHLMKHAALIRAFEYAGYTINYNMRITR